MGQQIWSLARGIDKRDVIPDRQAKSISNETTFAVDIDDHELLESWLMELAEQVARRLRTAGLKARTVQIKVRYDDFETVTRATSVPEPINSTREVWSLAIKMLNGRLPDRPLRVRLLGVGVSNLDRSGQTQGKLFEDGADQDFRLDGVTDEIRSRFGKDAVVRGIASVRGQARKEEK
jgi:DNA polymerase-4